MDSLHSVHSIKMPAKKAQTKTTRSFGVKSKSRKAQLEAMRQKRHQRSSNTSHSDQPSTSTQSDQPSSTPNLQSTPSSAESKPPSTSSAPDLSSPHGNSLPSTLVQMSASKQKLQLPSGVEQESVPTGDQPVVVNHLSQLSKLFVNLLCPSCKKDNLKLTTDPPKKIGMSLMLVVRCVSCDIDISSCSSS